MVKDYARRYRTPTKKGKKKAPRFYFRRFFVVFVLLLVVGAGIAGFYHYHRLALKMATQARADLLPPVENASQATIKTPPPAHKEDTVDYQFYTLLPEMSVPNPQQDNSPPGEQPGYWLQLMVYYNIRDAHAFLDRLQLMGLDPFIMQRKSTQTDHDLFIVVLGPFSTKDNAIARQQALKNIHLSSYIYHVDQPPPVEDAIPEKLNPIDT